MENRTPDDEESPLAPTIPSFASLRGGRPRSPADLLTSGRRADLQRPSSRPPAVRPAEWPDLWYLGLRVIRWCVQQPVSTVRRLIG